MVAQPEIPIEEVGLVGPYQIVREMVPGKWIIASDPVLRRPVWLLRLTSKELSLARRNLARPGRLRWLQEVETGEATWDAFEAKPGKPFSRLVEGGKRLPWGTLRHWLHDVAAEIWASTGDQALASELSFDHVWITAQGRAVLLDEPWPEVQAPAPCISVGNLAGQQRFLNAIAECVDPISIPHHARPLLKNLEEKKFEKLSFLTGTIRGLLDKPTEISKAIRAGSIFMLPLYAGIMLFLGLYTSKDVLHNAMWLLLSVAYLVLAASAIAHLLALPFRCSNSQAIFGLVVVNSKGERAHRSKLLVRWLIIWIPLLLPAALMKIWLPEGELLNFLAAALWLLLWVGAAVYAVANPHRGLHDRLVGTWVVRR
jgi:hypothetical protein